MRLSHARRAITVRFDDPNLVSCGGLVAVIALATGCWLPDLLADRLTLAGKGAANAAAKITDAPTTTPRSPPARPTTRLCAASNAASLTGSGERSHPGGGRARAHHPDLAQRDQRPVGRGGDPRRRSH